MLFFNLKVSYWDANKANQHLSSFQGLNFSSCRKQNHYPDQHQPFFALFRKLSMLFAIHIFLKSYNCTTATPVYL